MIRPFSCICMLLAGGAGLYLYQTKHRALLLDREIAHTIKQSDAARERITALRAEWALLNEPERLAELQTQHLGLKPLAPTQFVALADLPARLPAPLPAGAVVLPEPEEVVADRPASEPVRTATIARPMPVAPAPASVAPAGVNSAPGPLASPTLRPMRTAKREEPAAKPAAPTVASPATPPPVVAMVQPVRAPVIVAQPRPAAPSTATFAANSATAPGTVGESVLRASSLGTAHAAALPPPTPYTGR